MFTTCAKSSPAAARTLLRFVRVCLVCSPISALTTSLVFGSSGPWPDTKSRFPARIAWASGEGVPLSVNPVVGALCEVMICLGIALLERGLDLGRYRHRLQAVRVFGMAVRPDADLVTFDRAHAAVQHGVADLESLVVPLADAGLDHDLVAEPAGGEEARLGLDDRQSHDAVFLPEQIPIQTHRIEKEPGALVEPLEVVGIEDDPGGIGGAPVNGDVMVIGFDCSRLRRWIIAPRF